MERVKIKKAWKIWKKNKYANFVKVCFCCRFKTYTHFVWEIGKVDGSGEISENVKNKAFLVLKQINLNLLQKIFIWKLKKKQIKIDLKIKKIRYMFENFEKKTKYRANFYNFGKNIEVDNWKLKDFFIWKFGNKNRRVWKVKIKKNQKKNLEKNKICKFGKNVLILSYQNR